MSYVVILAGLKQYTHGIKKTPTCIKVKQDGF